MHCNTHDMICIVTHIKCILTDIPWLTTYKSNIATDNTFIVMDITCNLQISKYHMQFTNITKSHAFHKYHNVICIVTNITCSSQILHALSPISHSLSYISHVWPLPSIFMISDCPVYTWLWYLYFNLIKGSDSH